jgi:hypothetical protein
MRYVAPALALVVACTGLDGGSDPVAIEFVNPPDTILVDETTLVHVRVLNRDGDSIPGAPWTLTSLNPDTIGVDTARRAVIGLMAGDGRILATTGSLPSEPFRIVVTQP